MLYTDFINKAYDLTIEQADNGLFYLEPLWRNILYDNQMNVSDISDAKTDWRAIFDVLKLEVEKRNTVNSTKPEVLKWIYDIITAQVEPAILSEETDYVKAVTDFVKANHDKEKEEWERFTKT